MSSLSADQKNALDTQAVNNFREYLQIPSVHPNVNYEPCVKFLEKQAKILGLPIKVILIKPNKPIVIITWVGKEPNLPSILLNSHMDVVPVFEEEWTHKPFSAHVDEKGNIYARGTQDMKSVGIQYLEAVRRLKLQGVTLRRTIHISFVPDEEIGGIDGMKVFVDTNDFINLKVGFALDEGMASPNNELPIFYAERVIWQMHFHIPGHPGHASLLLENTAGEKASYLLNKLYEFRRGEQQKLKDNTNLTIGDVTTVNLTQIQGGVQANVIPPEFILTVDCRLAITVDFKKWEETLNRWCKEAGPGIYIEFEQKQSLVTPTKIDNSNPYWVALKEATDEIGLKLKPQVFPGGTDSRFIRNAGIPALGFSPIANTPVLLHDNDEFLSTDVFLKGIDTGLSLKPLVFPGGTDNEYIRAVGIPALGFSPINNTPVLLHDHDEYLNTITFLKGIGYYQKIVENIGNIPAFVKKREKRGVKLVPYICPGVTDVRYLRQKNIPGLGLSPIFETVALLHASNEYINKDTFIKGIGFYVKLIQSFANLK